LWNWYFFGTALIIIIESTKAGTAMKKGTCWLLCLAFLLTLCGCGTSRSGTGERAAVEFTVVPAEEVPQELSEILEKNKAREIRMTYQDGEELYLIRGYGEQKTGGYSISVAECSEDEENLYFLTQLIGPEDPEGLSEDPSYPYLVAKTARTDKNVEID